MCHSHNCRYYLRTFHNLSWVRVGSDDGDTLTTINEGDGDELVVKLKNLQMQEAISCDLNITLITVSLNETEQFWSRFLTHTVHVNVDINVPVYSNPYNC